MDRRQIERLSHQPLRLFREIWQCEWHALAVWAIAMPLIARYLRRGLVLPMRRHKMLLRPLPAAHSGGATAT